MRKNKDRNVRRKRSNSTQDTSELFPDIELPKLTIGPERFIKKSEFSRQNVVPACPIVPMKINRYRDAEPLKSAARLLSFSLNNEGSLSTLYRNDMSDTYLDQVFFHKCRVGEGSFGYVYKAISREDNNLYAIKHFNWKHPKSAKYAEVENMEKIGFHINIVKYFMAWEENDNVYIQMECCQMSLGQYSKIVHEIGENQICEIIHDVNNGLMYLHSKNFVHLDIKPDNILMEKGVYKLGDFGLLHNLNSNDEKRQSSSEGDSKYLACEVLAGVYTPKADVFALGVTALELATDFIMPSNGNIWHCLRSNYLPSNLADKISPELIILIAKMMVRDVKFRPSSKQVAEFSVINMVSKRDSFGVRTDYARHINLDNVDYPNFLHGDVRRVLDSENIERDKYQTPLNNNSKRKMVFSPCTDNVVRRSPVKGCNHHARVKLTFN